MTPARITAAALACLLALGAVAPSPARADDDDAATARARKHFARGEKLFALGRFAEALESYEAAFEAKPLPDFLFNVAQCHRNLGNLEQAVFGYRKYLKLDPDAGNRAAVETLIEQLEAEIEAAEARKRGRTLAPGPGDKDEPRGISPWWYVGGGAVVVVLTVGAVVLLSGDDGPSIPDSDLGNLDFGR